MHAGIGLLDRLWTSKSGSQNEICQKRTNWLTIAFCDPFQLLASSLSKGMHGAKYESTGFTDSASAVCIILLCMYAYIIMYDVLQLAAICTVLVVVYTTTTKYRDATVV